MSDADEAGRAAERVARESYGRLVAFLAARTRDVAGAEDALSEAFAAALRMWPVGRRAGQSRRLAADRGAPAADRRHPPQADPNRGEEHVKLIADEIEAAADERDAIPDRRLALMFACAHPAIERGMRTPLILQTILGLTAEDIAAAFLIPPATMGQRLVRAKTRIRDAGIPFRVPEAEELPERLDAVLDAIYAAYTKGWNEVGEAGVPELADEAIWLGRLVVSLLPDEPEAKGMLALMLYAEARRPPVATPPALTSRSNSRTQASGTITNRARRETAARGSRSARPAATSSRRRSSPPTPPAHDGAANWPVVVEALRPPARLTNSPVVVLNRAVALAEVEGPEAALAAIAPLATTSACTAISPTGPATRHIC